MSESKTISEMKTKRHFITVASWESDVSGVSYEVGVRDRDREGPRGFCLVSKYLGSEDEAVLIGSAAKLLSKAGWSKEQMYQVFR